MADFRKEWTYTDENGIERTEPVSIQGKEFGASAPANRIVDPNGRSGSQPRTNGWYDEVPKGKEFTYSFARLSTMLSEIEAKGIPSWSALTDYPLPAVAWGSNGELYRAILASDHTDPKDPISEPLYWQTILLTNGGVGKISMYPWATPLPHGHLVCDGQLVTVAAYPALYAVLGNRYGGTPAVDFNVPDYRGVFLRGYDGAGGADQGAAVTIDGTASIGDPVITDVSSFTNLELGMVVESNSGDGAVVDGSTIVDFTYATDTATGIGNPLPLESLTLSANATATGAITINFTNRTDRGDGVIGDRVGTKQTANTGFHQHAMQYETKAEIGSLGAPIINNWSLLAHQDQVTPAGAAVAMDAVSKVGTYPTLSAETRPPNVSIMFCIKYM
jgi:microcystin-dependent protein